MKIAIFILTALLTVGAMSAQTAAPTVVQAAVAPSVAIQTPPAPPSATAVSALKMLQEMKAANENVLKKQAATLLQLEEIQKAAEQLRIYTKRG